MDATALRIAFDDLLDAATAATGTPEPGEWNSAQVLGHVSLITATTLATAADVAGGVHTRYDNRPSQDVWTIGRLVDRAGDTATLCARIRRQGEALRALVPALGDAELATPVPALLLSHDALLVDAPITLHDILTGFADVELPGHTAQLRALQPEAVAV